MAETRYQKYLARKRQKQEQEQKTGQARTARAGSMSWQMAVAANAPLLHCMVPAGLFEQGIGNLIFSRSLPQGHIALSVFLLDVYCLGIKNAFFSIVPREVYDLRRRQFEGDGNLQQTDPACFRKLVEGGVAYAQNLGFSPHADYAQARQLFGNVDAAACASHFEYGHEGMPFYISGPNETRARSREIIGHLDRRLGPEKFHYMVNVGSGPEGSINDF